MYVLCQRLLKKDPKDLPFILGTLPFAMIMNYCGNTPWTIMTLKPKPYIVYHFIWLLLQYFFILSCDTSSFVYKCSVTLFLELNYTYLGSCIWCLYKYLPNNTLILNHLLETENLLQKSMTLFSFIKSKTLRCHILSAISDKF